MLREILVIRAIGFGPIVTPKYKLEKTTCTCVYTFKNLGRPVGTNKDAGFNVSIGLTKGTTKEAGLMPQMVVPKALTKKWL